MAEEKLLTIRDVSLILNITEKEVMDLAENGLIPAYRIGGVYLRFKPQQVEDYRRRIKVSVPKDKAVERKVSFAERVKDFFYFNDFYIFSLLLVSLILFIIFRGY